MKQNIFKKIGLSALYLLFLITIFSHYSFAQVSKIDNEILVYFLPDSLELTEELSETTDMKKIKIKSQSLDKAMKKIELESVKRTFPNFNQADTIKMRKDGKKIKLPNMSRIFTLKLKNKDGVDIAIKLLSEEKGVLFAEKNGGASVDLIPSDEYFTDQWGLKNSGQFGGTIDADIDAEEAWDIFTGSSSIKIGIIDNGVDRNHQDLYGKVSGSTTIYGNHGTHVAGIAAAKANNIVNNESYGVAGVDWNAQIIAKASNDGYESGDAYRYQIITEAVNEGANVLNNSWKLLNSDGTPGRYSSTVRMAFTYAYKNNVVSVASSGNTGNSGNIYQYPAGFGQGILAVGATDHNDNIASFSTHQNYVDVSAPGVNIFSSISSSPYFDYYSGTSMAAPFVTGIASLLKGYNSNLFNDDIENIIKISAEDKNSTTYPGWDQYLGTGRVNARKALNYLRAPYVLEHNSASGGSVYSSTDNYTIVFFGVSGLSDGVYIVKRYEVRKTVSLNSSLLDKQVWGRGVNTVGFSAASPNYGMGWCDVVSTSSTSATLRTYVYYVYSILGQPIGYYPTSPSNVEFEYTVLGYTLSAPTISMSGGIGDNPTLTFSYNENVVDHYVLKKEYDFGSGFNASYVNPASNPYTDNNVEITRFGGDLVARYSVKVVDALGNESSYSNTVSTDGQSLWKENIEQNENEVIKEYALESNYPNPFNPTTKINYQLPKDSFVNLIVYNTLGQKVTVLVNKQQTSGKYSVQFDASNLPSGVYIYKLQAGEFSSVKKMLLTK